MRTLWHRQGIATDGSVLAFTAGEDGVLDRRLVPYDILGSIAHTRGLARIGVLSGKECADLCGALADMHSRWKDGRFSVGPDDEDVHTAIERALTQRLGETGRKIHAGRSRNDQVLTALRLLMKDGLLDLMERLASVALGACECGANHEGLIMPGYTHGQKAMPSTVAFWYASLVEGWADALEAGRAVHERLDCSPLGAAAGYGVPLPLDRGYTAELMGFGRVQVNAQAVQNSRGRLEAAFLGWLVEVGRDVEKMACDLLLFSSDAYGFVRIPGELCTGSSIMPHKSNPDLIELLRAMPSVLKSCRDEVESAIAKLPSSYHRDLQLTKAPLMRGIDCATSMLEAVGRVVPAIGWDARRLGQACSVEIFAAHRAMDLVEHGMAFREAYAVAATELADGRTNEWDTDPGRIVAGLAHEGAPGNPGLELAAERIGTVKEWVRGTRKMIWRKWKDLLSAKV